MSIAGNKLLSRRSVLQFGATACCIPYAAIADIPSSTFKLKISVDTGANHVRNLALQMFSRRLATESSELLEAVVFPSAQLANDRDVVKALYWGLADVGVPAISKLTRYESNANLFTLPMFYGSELGSVHAINDGVVGQDFYRRLERQTQTHMLGRPIDLGYTNLYTTHRRVTSIEDIAGLKVRVPGSRASLELYKLFGGNPIVVPFGDLAIALSQGNVDAVQTTHETIRSGRLWESGIRYCYEEKSSYLGYVPLVSLRTWGTLTGFEQRQMSAAWESVVDDARSLARQRQQEAREELQERGVEIAVTDAAVSASIRELLFKRSASLAAEIGMDRELVRSAAKVLRGAVRDGST